MKRMLWLAALVLINGGYLCAQTDYTNRQRLSERVQALSRKYPGDVKTTSLAQTHGGSDIWLITIGRGETTQKPAIAVVGGVEGRHLLGVELAMGFAENLLTAAGEEPIATLLDRQVFYVFPNMSPDATEQYFASLRYERSGNARVIDDDRDGKTGEDGYEDLNNDGRITMIRVEDPTGTYIVNPDDPRSMIQADPAKGQVGKYQLYTEGIDNDKDGEFNEDGAEGVHFNKNMTYNYKNFISGAGEHAVSEIESRALLDFLYDAYNVYCVMTFGPYNNLSHPIQPPPGTATSATGRDESEQQSRRGSVSGGITGWSATDAQVNRLAAARYRDIISAGNAPRTIAGPGDFAEWAYFHYGRLSFSTPGWWVPLTEDTETGSSRREGSRQKPVEDPVALYLQWADREGISAETFTAWTAVTHPDFPDKKVEVGGVHPFALHNPPYRMVPDLAEKHTAFITELAGMAPFIEFADVRTEKVDRDLTRVTLKIFNRGLLPTLSQVGERSYFLKRLSVTVDLSANQEVMSGKSRQTLGAIPPRDYVELSWLIRGHGKLTINAGSPNTGSDRVELSL